MEMGMGEEERNVDEVWPANYSAGIKGGRMPGTTGGSLRRLFDRMLIK